MPVRSELLAAGRRTDATLTQVYMTPDGATTILKSFALFNVGAAVANLVTISMDAGAFNQTVFWEGAIPARGFLYEDLWVVMPPFVELGIRGVAGGSINYWFSGAELAGVSS